MAAQHSEDRESFGASEQDLVLSTLELDQLADVKKKRVPRRHLTSAESALLWTLRLYLFFMIAVVIYQVFSGVR